MKVEDEERREGLGWREGEKESPLFTFTLSPRAFEPLSPPLLKLTLTSFLYHPSTINFNPNQMSLRLISRRCSSLRTLPLATLSPSSSSVFLTLNRFKSSKDDVPETPRDPYPLPLSHPIAPDLDSTLAELTSFEIPPLDRSHEDMGTTRKRLVYQVRKRGMLEGDLLLATFARDKLPSMTDDEVREFDKVSSNLLSRDFLPFRGSRARRSRAREG